MFDVVVSKNDYSLREIFIDTPVGLVPRVDWVFFSVRVCVVCILCALVYYVLESVLYYQFIIPASSLACCSVARYVTCAVLITTLESASTRSAAPLAAPSIPYLM